MNSIQRYTQVPTTSLDTAENDEASSSTRIGCIQGVNNTKQCICTWMKEHKRSALLGVALLAGLLIVIPIILTTAGTIAVPLAVGVSLLLIGSYLFKVISECYEDTNSCTTPLCTLADNDSDDEEELLGSSMPPVTPPPPYTENDQNPLTRLDPPPEYEGFVNQTIEDETSNNTQEQIRLNFLVRGSIEEPNIEQETRM